jgi:hypothetical protein
MMYGKEKKQTSKVPKKEASKGMPVAIMIAVGKPKNRAMPMRGARTATNMMKKSGRGK